jgi:predicted DNA-binding protein
MAKTKQKAKINVSVPLNMDMYNFLNSYCERTGQPKTAVLRAVLVRWRESEEYKGSRD